MHHTPKFTLSVLAVLVVLAVLLTGCGTIDKALYKQEVVQVPGQVTKTNTVLVTNVVAVAASTNQVVNAATGATEAVVVPASIKQVITPIITYDYAPPTLVTNLVPREGISSAIEGGSSLIPLPGAGLIGILLGWGYTAYASIRNKKTSAALVTGIEAGRKILQETPEGQKLDAKVKQALIEHQDVAGVLNNVSNLVNQYTTKTTKTLT